MARRISSSTARLSLLFGSRFQMVFTMTKRQPHPNHHLRPSAPSSCASGAQRDVAEENHVPWPVVRGRKSELLGRREEIEGKKRKKLEEEEKEEKDGKDIITVMGERIKRRRVGEIENRDRRVNQTTAV